MKIAKGNTMYIGCVYIRDTKSNLNFILYGNTRAYKANEWYKANSEIKELIKNVYNRIMSGELVYLAIENFDKHNVILNETSCEIRYKYDADNDGIVREELLCAYKVKKIEIAIDREGEFVLYHNDNYKIRHMFHKYGLFWYLICNVDTRPVIVKRFLWFIKLDKMLYYLFNKFEYMEY